MNLNIINCVNLLYFQQDPEIVLNTNGYRLDAIKCGQMTEKSPPDNGKAHPNDGKNTSSPKFLKSVRYFRFFLQTFSNHESGFGISLHGTQR